MKTSGNTIMVFFDCRTGGNAERATKAGDIATGDAHIGCGLEEGGSVI